MGALVEGIQKIGECKIAIHDALVEKNVDMVGIPFSGYAERIKNIQEHAIPEIVVKSYIPTVNFYDLYGNVLSSLTYSDVNTMTELPPVPKYVDEARTTVRQVEEWDLQWLISKITDPAYANKPLTVRVDSVTADQWFLAVYAGDYPILYSTDVWQTSAEAESQVEFIIDTETSLDQPLTGIAGETISKTEVEVRDTAYLTSTGWTHTLAEIQRATRNGHNYDVGPTYETPNHETRLYVTATVEMLNTELWARASAANACQLDWGDGSDIEVIPANTFKIFSHTFPAAGDYVIVISPIASYMASHTELPTVEFGGGSSKNLICVNFGNINASSGTTSNNVLARCRMLRKAELGDMHTSIWARAFQQCNYLKVLLLPKTLTLINDAAFTGLGVQSDNLDNGLKILVLPKHVSFNGSYHFQKAYSLQYIVIPELDDISTTKNDIGEATFEDCWSLKRLTIPVNNNVIGNWAFSRCYSLETISNQRSTTAGYPAVDSTNYKSHQFNECRHLRNLKLDDGMGVIPDQMFQNCHHLTDVTLPSTIIKILAQAFSGCQALATVDLSRLTAVPELSNANAFYDVHPLCVFKVKTGMRDAFMAISNWRTVMTNQYHTVVEV